jgi:hypothetical protein
MRVGEIPVRAGTNVEESDVAAILFFFCWFEQVVLIFSIYEANATCLDFNFLIILLKNT